MQKTIAQARFGLLALFGFVPLGVSWVHLPRMTNSADISNQPQYPVTIWETIAITVSALLLMAVGLAGLMYKFFSNAADPQRATLIAQSLLSYDIPGGAQGVFGANLGGAKVAIVSSSSFPKGDISNLTPADLANVAGIEIFVARVPLDVDTATDSAAPKAPPSSTKEAESYDIFSAPDFSFSYRTGEEFQVTGDRIEALKFCGSEVPVRVQEGNFLLSEQLPRLNAVKYDAIANFNDSKRQVTLIAIGKDAASQAKAVFNSLQCK